MSIPPWFEAAAGFERDVLARNDQLTAVHDEFRAAGRARLTAAGAMRVPSPWRGVSSSSAMRQAVVEAEVFALLREYASRAASVIGQGDATRWRALVDEGLRRSGRGLLVDEVHDSTVGALLLRDAWGFRPAVPNSAVVDCACGYAETGVVTRKLCLECGETVVRRWAAEELRLLSTVPEYAARVEDILAEAEKRQAKGVGARSETPFADAESQRSRGGRALRRLRRTGRRLLSSAPEEVPTPRWVQLGALAAKAMQTRIGHEGKRAPARGLGAAGLAALALRSDRDIIG